MQPRVLHLGSLGILLFAIGCSRGPARVEPPEIDAEAAADKAMELYDKDRDGALNQQELASCPGIVSMLSLYDQNGDQRIDRNEIAGRLSNLLKHRVGLTQLRSRVNFRGKPLANASITFEPEPYLGSEIQPAEGTTNSQGSAQMGISADSLPESVRGMKLLHYGTYKVRITHPTIKLPAKYNAETTLGYETIAGNPFVTFSLNP